jgi:hypothetical protein
VGLDVLLQLAALLEALAALVAHVFALAGLEIGLVHSNLVLKKIKAQNF